jgi:hypothetical protein
MTAPAKGKTPRWEAHKPCAHLYRRPTWGDMNDNRNDDRIIAECRAAVSAMATAFVTHDPVALRYLSGVLTAGPDLPASQFMLSSVRLLEDVLTTGIAARLGRDPTDAEIVQAWRSYEATATERVAAALQRLADEQIRAGLPEDEVRSTIANSASVTDAGLATALPLPTAFIEGNEAPWLRMLAAAAKERKISAAVRATPLIIRDLFETAVNTAYGVATEQQIHREWENFMLERSAAPGP